MSLATSIESDWKLDEEIKHVPTARGVHFSFILSAAINFGCLYQLQSALDNPNNCIIRLGFGLSNGSDYQTVD